MRVLITGPSLSVPGGVAAYCRSVHACLGAGATYLPVGARGGGEGFVRGLPRLIRDYANFTRMVALGGFDVVHLNPSFASKALVREALFLLISKLFRKPVVVYLHGWVSECERAVRARLPSAFPGLRRVGRRDRRPRREFPPDVGGIGDPEAGVRRGNRVRCLLFLSR